MAAHQPAKDAYSVDNAILSIQKAESQLTLLGEDFTKIVLDPEMKEDLQSILVPAVTYKNQFLPQIIETMTAVKDVSEYYTEMSFEDWQGSLELLQEDAQKGNTIVLKQQNVHASLMESLRKKTIELKGKSQALHISASGKETSAAVYVMVAVLAGVLAAAACVVAVVNPGAPGGVAAYAVLAAGGVAGGSFLAYGSMGCKTAAKQLAAQGKKKGALAKQIDEGLCQRLKEFGVTLHALAGFFGNLLDEVGSENQAKEAHYLKYKDTAPTLHKTCSKFIAAVPMMKSQLQGIPSDSNVEELRITIGSPGKND